MKKLNMGYAKYFNEKYKRKGTLFESRYKSILITQEAHFLHLPYYIHCNPLDLFAPEWRENKLNSHRNAIKFLETYRWSSHLDYLGKHNFPSVTKREFLLEIFNGEKEYKKSICNWLKSLALESVSRISLE
jgi:putative transposase